MKSFRSTGTGERSAAARRSCDRPAEVRSIGQHRDRGRAMLGVESRPLCRVQILPNGPADGDRRFTSATTATLSFRREARNEGGPGWPRPRAPGSRAGCAAGQSPAGRAQDFVQGNGDLVLRPVFGYLHSGSIRSDTAASEEILMPLTKRQSEILSYLQGHINGRDTLRASRRLPSSSASNRWPPCTSI